MKWPKKYVYLSAAVLLLLGAGLFLYWKLDPARHFRHADIPVLAVPDEKADVSQGTGSDRMSSSTDSRNSSAEVPKAKAKQAGFNVLILGTDAREHEASRTDVIMLARVNPFKNRINLISIPRDTRVAISGVGYTKINHAHILGEMKGGGHSGTEASIQAVSNLCSCTINYYIKTNFEGFEHFIDKIGGLDVELDHPVKLTYADTTLQAGKHHLSGAEALNFVRERKSLPGGDSGRQANQALVLKQIVRTLIRPENIKNLPSLISQVKKDILDTNLSDSDMISLAWMAKGMEEDQFQYGQVPGHSGKAMDPLVKSELYYWIPDMEKWKAMLQKFLGD